MYLAELGLAGLVLPSPALGLPSMPPPSPTDFRGVAIHWLAMALPTTGPSLRFAPTVPVPTWGWTGILFSSLSTDRVDRQPLTTVERDAYVRLAAAMAVARHNLSQQSTLLWEILTPASGLATFRVRSGGRILERTQRNGDVSLRVRAVTPGLIQVVGEVELRALVRFSEVAGAAQKRGTARIRETVRIWNLELPGIEGVTTVSIWVKPLLGGAIVRSSVWGATATVRSRIRFSEVAGVAQKKGAAVSRGDVRTEATFGTGVHSSTAVGRVQSRGTTVGAAAWS